MSDDNITLSDEEMVAWANASIDRVRELEAELKSHLKYYKVTYYEQKEAKDLAVERITFLLAENERLTAELKATQENEQHLSDANKPLLAENERLTAERDDLQYANDFCGKTIERLQAENERLTAVYEAADRICNKPIYSKSDEDRLREALAAVKEKIEDHRLDEAITEYYTDLRGKDDE